VTVQLILGDCLDVMRALEENSIDSIVTDPPYGLGFMGKEWDHGVPGVAFWEAALRVAKPGCHMLAFGGTRTHHRLMCAIEDAGWEIRDTVMWVYGSGFPKSLDVSKAIDKAVGAEREVIGSNPNVSNRPSKDGEGFRGQQDARITAPATPEALRWKGWGTAAKPAFEPVIVARKPLDGQSELYTIVGNLSRLEAQLWLLSHASDAGKTSPSSQSEYDAACASARWGAAEPRSIRDALCAQMGTSQFELATATTLSTVSSWLATWDAALRRGSMFTIATATSQIIDLRTLSCSASALTPQAIIKAATNQPGSWWSALPAAAVLHVAATRLSGTLELIAVESAIESGLMPHPDAIDPTVLAKPIIVARKPLVGTVAENVLQHGTGAINIDGCRVGMSKDVPASGTAVSSSRTYAGGFPPRRPDVDSGFNPNVGRWPANLIHDGSDEVLAGFPNETARFFYSPKASKADRDEGCEEMPERAGGAMQANVGDVMGLGGASLKGEPKQRQLSRNHHPTVKPTALMRYLCRLVTPPGGVVLDPFMGSGSTGKAAALEGFGFVGIEIDGEYLEIARRRIAEAQTQPTLEGIK
jgi:DNA modification methylase